MYWKKHTNTSTQILLFIIAYTEANDLQAAILLNIEKAFDSIIFVTFMFLSINMNPTLRST